MCEEPASLSCDEDEHTAQSVTHQIHTWELFRKAQVPTHFFRQKMVLAHHCGVVICSSWCHCLVSRQKRSAWVAPRSRRVSTHRKRLRLLFEFTSPPESHNTADQAGSRAGFVALHSVKVEASAALGDAATHSCSCGEDSRRPNPIAPEYSAAKHGSTARRHAVR